MMSALACSKARIAASRPTVGKSSRNSFKVWPPSRYSKRVWKGTRVPRKTGVPPRTSGSRTISSLLDAIAVTSRFQVYSEASTEPSWRHEADNQLYCCRENSLVFAVCHNWLEGGSVMPVKQGDLALLQLPAARELLQSKLPARLAYVWMDGTPRVVPIWFHWNGSEFVMGTPPNTPKVKALARNPKV